MDDPVAIALLLSGSSAVIALALIGRRLMKERAETAAAAEDVFAARISPDAEAPSAAPAPADDDVFAARISSGAPAPAEAPAAAASAPEPAADDPFADRISSDAPPAEPHRAAATPAEADIFASHVSAEAGAPARPEPADDPEPAAPAGAEVEPAGGEAPTDVFTARINPDAPAEITPSTPAEPDPGPSPTPDDDVFAARISADAGKASTDEAPDPFSRFIEAQAAADDAGSADSIYPAETCHEFAQGLKDEVLDRALTLFWALAREGSIDSNDLGALLGARSRQAGALVSTPMKRRSEEMDLPLPYVIGRSSPSRLRTWSDQFGIAERMAAALLAEQQARDTTTDDDPEGLAGLTAWLAQQSESEISLTIDEIDALGPAGLPEHAANERNWWANRSGGPGHGHAEAWLSAGRLAYPDLKAGMVTFELLPGLQAQAPAETEDVADEANIGG